MAFLQLTPETLVTKILTNNEYSIHFWERVRHYAQWKCCSAGLHYLHYSSQTTLDYIFIVDCTGHNLQLRMYICFVSSFIFFFIPQIDPSVEQLTVNTVGCRGDNVLTLSSSESQPGIFSQVVDDSLQMGQPSDFCARGNYSFPHNSNPVNITIQQSCWSNSRCSGTPSLDVTYRSARLSIIKGISVPVEAGKVSPLSCSQGQWGGGALYVAVENQGVFSLSPRFSCDVGYGFDPATAHSFPYQCRPCKTTTSDGFCIDSPSLLSVRVAGTLCVSTTIVLN